MPITRHPLAGTPEPWRDLPADAGAAPRLRKSLYLLEPFGDDLKMRFCVLVAQRWSDPGSLDAAAASARILNLIDLLKRVVEFMGQISSGGNESKSTFVPRSFAEEQPIHTHDLLTFLVDAMRDVSQLRALEWTPEIAAEWRACLQLAV